MMHIKDCIFDLENILPKCHRMQKKVYKKGEVITNYLLNRKQICILLSGSADLIRYESFGEKIIVERYSKYDLFGEVFHPITTNNELFVVAQTDSLVIQFTYDEINEKCSASCKNHNLLTTRLFDLVFYKTIRQNLRIEILSKTTIREKLLFYFSYLESSNYQKKFTIPFSYTDFADYLNVNRSALMRELKNLQDDGFIKRNGKVIQMLF